MKVAVLDLEALGLSKEFEEIMSRSFVQKRERAFSQVLDNPIIHSMSFIGGRG